MSLYDDLYTNTKKKDIKEIIEQLEGNSINFVIVESKNIISYIDDIKKVYIGTDNRLNFIGKNSSIEILVKSMKGIRGKGITKYKNDFNGDQLNIDLTYNSEVEIFLNN